MLAIPSAVWQWQGTPGGSKKQGAIKRNAAHLELFGLRHLHKGFTGFDGSSICLRDAVAPSLFTTDDTNL
jgi:hypothetical protein